MSHIRKLHQSTFEYLKPTTDQIATMQVLRDATKNYAAIVSNTLTDSATKDMILQKIRECGMWANVAVTREDDGSPKDGAMSENNDEKKPPENVEKAKLTEYNQPDRKFPREEPKDAK